MWLRLVIVSNDRRTIIIIIIIIIFIFIIITIITISYKLCKNIVFNTLKKHMFWIFVKIASERRF